MLTRDYSNASSNFYDNNGIIKKPPEHLPSRIYSLGYHLNKSKNETIKKEVKVFINECQKHKGLTIQISQKKISLMKRFIFLYIEVRRNFVNLHMKGEKSWDIVKIDNQNTNYFKTVIRELKILEKSGENTFLKRINL